MSNPAPLPFTPKTLSVLKEGYGLPEFGQDSIAGLTVAIVALPLSMAIAIASHATPAAGLITAVIGGFVISALGGSRFQIGGPAGAFIVLVANTIDKFGYDGLLLATIGAGVIMLLMGLLRLGSLIRLVPHPVIVGFSSGIAIIIAASQVKDLFGLSLTAEPAAVIPKLEALASALNTMTPAALALSAIAVIIIVVQRKFRPAWPGFLIAVVACAAAALAFHLPVETIATKFGGIPHGLPLPHMPQRGDYTWTELLPATISIALLGSIESLLSALVADRMRGRQHRSNMELVAQGVANIACGLFGGITATGTIARTATNVRAGAHGPVSGIMHAVYILAFMMIAAPLAGYIPLSALAAILIIVAWNMAEREELLHLLHNWISAIVVLATIGITLFHDLMSGIITGTLLHYGLNAVFGREEDKGPPAEP
jgi:sulfate permease, SulP family